MKLKPFGEIKTSWSEPSLSHVVGYVETLIHNEDERTENRKWKGILDVRLELMEEAYALLQVVDNDDHKLMRDTLRKIKQGNDEL